MTWHLWRMIHVISLLISKIYWTRQQLLNTLIMMMIVGCALFCVTAACNNNNNNSVVVDSINTAAAADDEVSQVSDNDGNDDHTVWDMLTALQHQTLETTQQNTCSWAHDGEA